MTAGAGDSNSAQRQHYGITFAVLAISGASYALLQSAVAPALPDIQKELHSSATATAWLLTGYLLSASVTTPIVGRLGDMFGKEHTLVFTMAGLGAGTLLAALAHSIGLLITARVIQGAGGAIFPLSFGIIRDEFPREKAAHGIALISAILGIGGGIGIILAGPIISAFSYHWLFWFPLIVIVAATLATIFFVPESPVKSPGRVDWLGAALLSAWLGLLLLGITQSSEWGWGDPRMIGLIVAAAAVLAVWIKVEADRHKQLVDMVMMRARSVWTVNAAAFLVGAGMYSSFILIPEFTEMPASTGYGFGSSVTQAGLFLLPATVMMVLVSPLAGSLAARVGSRAVLIAGCLTVTVSFTLLHPRSRHLRRHRPDGRGDRPRLRLARQPDRRGGAAAADRGGDGDEHGDADPGRIGRRPGRRQPDRRHRGRLRAAERGGFHPRLRLRRRRLPARGAGRLQRPAARAAGR